MNRRTAILSLVLSPSAALVVAEQARRDAETRAFINAWLASVDVSAMFLSWLERTVLYQICGPLSEDQWAAIKATTRPVRYQVIEVEAREVL